MDFPSKNELVITRIKKIFDYGVIVDLVEFDDLEGFVHISNVASSWVKNIRNFVKENQLRVGRVIKVDSLKNQVDISFSRVNKVQENNKLNEFRALKRAQGLIEALAQKTNSSFDLVWNEVAIPLQDEFGSLHKAFEKIRISGESVLKGLIKSSWITPLVEVINANIEMPEKTLKAVIYLQSFAFNGVEVIKEVLKKLVGSTKDADVEIYYAGSKKFILKVSSFNYKTAERVMNFLSMKLNELTKSFDVVSKFERMV